MFKFKLLIVLLITSLGLVGCFGKQVKEDQAQVNLICEENSMVFECRIAQAYKTLAAINNGIAELVRDSRETEAEESVLKIARTYQKGLPHAEAALEAATLADSVNDTEGAIAKLTEATKFIDLYQEYSAR